jgi:uncharacterized protein YcfJ
MKTRIYFCIGIVAIFACDAYASSTYYATVVDSTPIYKTVRVTTPRQECWEEEVAITNRSDNHYRSGNGGGVIVGGLIGGAIGHSVGHRKRNKQVGTLVGAVLGATIGSAYASQRNAVQRTIYTIEERCEVIEETHTEERIVGYNVRYRYSNVTYSTRTDMDPGDTIKVRVAVTPIIQGLN